MSVCLLWRETLLITQVHDVLEHRRAGRQVRRIQEQYIEVIVTAGRAVYRRATLEYSRVVLGVVHAHQRPVVVHLDIPQGFEVAEEVVQATVGTHVLGTPAGLREG